MEDLARATGLALLSAVVACAAFQGERAGGGGGAADEVLVESATLATEVELATLAPVAGTTGRSFPPSTPVLYFAFLVERAPAGTSLEVTWARQGEDEPFQRSRLAVTGRRWMAVAHEPIRAFPPGAYLVRLFAGERLLEELPFVVQGGEPVADRPAAPGFLQVSSLRFQADQGGAPAGPSVTVLPPEARRVHCSFTVRGAEPGARLEVRWLRGGDRVATSHLGVPEGEAPALTVSLERSEPLRPGLYRVEVVSAGAVARAGTFTVLTEAEPGSAGPRVSNLVLTTIADERTGRPTGPQLTTVRGDEPVLFLTFTYAGMAADDVLEVRWLRDGEPDGPLATGSYAVAGRGNVAASLEPGEALPVGDYRVEVVRSGATLGARRFAVERE